MVVNQPPWKVSLKRVINNIIILPRCIVATILKNLFNLLSRVYLFFFFFGIFLLPIARAALRIFEAVIFNKANLGDSVPKCPARNRTIAFSKIVINA